MMTKMMKCLGVALLAFFCVACSTTLVQKRFDREEVMEDYEQVRETLYTQHPMIFADKQELSQLFNRQRQLLRNGMLETDFYRLLAPLVAKIRCGHTRLSYSERYQKYNEIYGKFLPLSVAVSNGHAYILNLFTEQEVPLIGSELVSINQRPIHDIITDLLNSIPADGDNMTRKYYIMNHWFSGVYSKYIGESEQYRIEVKDSASHTVRTYDLPAITKSELDASVPSASLAWKMNGAYSSSFEHDHYALLSLHSFDCSRSKFERFLDDFFAHARDKDIANVIIDFRGNWGGDPRNAAYLLSYLIQKDFLYFKDETPGYPELRAPIKQQHMGFNGNVYILIDGASFSTTAHACSLLKYHKRGTFIGQETAGSFICTDNAEEIELEHTELTLAYSTMIFQTMVSGMPFGRGIIPDYVIVPTLEDLLGGRDVEMDKAIELIHHLR